MAFFILKSDFVGEINLIFKSDLQGDIFAMELITQFENQILLDLLGDYLYNALISDSQYNASTERYEPHTQMYKDLLYGVNYTDLTGKFTVYEGILIALKRMIFYYYKVENQRHDTKTGTAKYTNGEASELLTLPESEREASNQFNKAIIYYNRVIVYIENNYQTLFTGENFSQFSFWMPIRFNQKNKIFSSTVSAGWYARLDNHSIHLY